MKRHYIASIIFCLGILSCNVQAQVNIFACEPEWAALAEEIGGKHVKVFAATHAKQDPHHIRARPSFIAKIRRADLVICSGAGSKEDVLNLVKISNCDGVGIGSMFHYNYIKKVESKYMSYNSNKLRMGKEIDSGNIEFIKKITLIYII